MMPEVHYSGKETNYSRTGTLLQSTVPYNNASGRDAVRNTVAGNICLTFGLLCSLYLTLSLLYYEKTRHSTEKKKPVIAIRKCGARRMLAVLLITAAILLDCSMVMAVCLQNIDVKSTDMCNIAFICIVTTYVLHDTAIYSFLWARQHAFYQSVIITRKFLGKIVSFTRWLILALIITLTIAMIGVTATQRPRVHHESGSCLYEVANSTSFDVALIWVPAGFLLHVSMLPLLALPLIRQLSVYKERRSCAAFQRTKQTLMRHIRRCLAVSAACTATDFTAIAIDIFVLSGRNIHNQGAVLFNANLLVNTVLVVFTFEGWKRKLFPWFMDKAETENTTDTTSRHLPTDATHF